MQKSEKSSFIYLNFYIQLSAKTQTKFLNTFVLDDPKIC